jgi:hypothetical protein
MRLINHPSPRHDLIAFYDELQPLPVFGSGDSRQKAVSRNPARATTEDVDIVDSKKERFSMGVSILNKFAFPEASLLGLCIKLLTVFGDTDTHSVLRLMTVSSGIPQLRLI